MEKIEARVRQFADEHEIVVWDEIPWNGAIVNCPESTGVEEFLNLAIKLGCKIIYLDPSENDGAIAVDGVIHLFTGNDIGAVEWSSGDEDDDDEAAAEDELIATPAASPGSFYKLIGNPYFDHSTMGIIEDRLREIVDAIVSDPDYDGSRKSLASAKYLESLDGTESDLVTRIAQRVFGNTVGKDLDHEALQITEKLAKDPDFDPLNFGHEYEQFIEEKAPGLDQRVFKRVQRGLSNYSWESGARDKADKEIEKRAKELLKKLEPAIRDQLGFCKRNEARRRLISPYLDESRPNWATLIVREAARLEEELHGGEREQRYATAARKLKLVGLNNSKVSRVLGISTSVIDRLTMTYNSDVILAEDDPIVTDLATDFFSRSGN
ncbi:hypothetical protein [Dietzia maris]|uniref:hypothetical protein n=1 Tax=Dietzia maris TaxID=37915 RepID=UPI0037C7F526